VQGKTATTQIPNLRDGKEHQVAVIYQPDSLQVRVDDLTTPLLTVAVDLSSLLDLDSGKAWVGFTAATGGAFENHDIPWFHVGPLQ
jgi:hypothetical protein